MQTTCVVSASTPHINSWKITSKCIGYKITQPLQIWIGPTISIGQESWCLPYAGFLTKRLILNIDREIYHVRLGINQKSGLESIKTGCWRLSWASAHVVPIHSKEGWNNAVWLPMFGREVSLQHKHLFWALLSSLQNNSQKSIAPWRWANICWTALTIH